MRSNLNLKTLRSVMSASLTAPALLLLRLWHGSKVTVTLVPREPQALTTTLLDAGNLLQDLRNQQAAIRMRLQSLDRVRSRPDEGKAAREG